MADNSRKTPLQPSLARIGQAKAQDALQLTGKSLPCSIVRVVSSGIVTVKFEVNSAPFTLPDITVPVEMSEYLRLPLQVGDKGWVRAADARLGGVTGLGAGVASLNQPGNLAALVFAPLGSTTWTVVDLNALVGYGPNGFVLRDTASNTTIVGTPTSLTLTRGGASITLTGGNVEIVGTLIINGDAYLAHEHSGVQTGSGNSGGGV